MHFAIFPEEGSIRVEHGAGIVIDAGGAPLEKRDNENNFFLPGDFGERFGYGTRNGLGKIEQIGVLLAAKIFAPKQFM